MSSTRSRAFIFPSIPRGEAFVDKNGNMTAVFANFLDYLTSNLNDYFNIEGFKIPQLGSTDIALLTGDQSFYRIIYNKDTNQYLANVNGTWKTIQLV
jgi:hypothetical protein